VCVCVCGRGGVGVRERERESARGSESERDSHIAFINKEVAYGFVRVSTCACVLYSDKPICNFYVCLCVYSEYVIGLGSFATER